MSRLKANRAGGPSAKPAEKKASRGKSKRASSKAGAGRTANATEPDGGASKGSKKKVELQRRVEAKNRGSGATPSVKHGKGPGSIVPGPQLGKPIKKVAGPAKKSGKRGARKGK